MDHVFSMYHNSMYHNPALAGARRSCPKSGPQTSRVGRLFKGFEVFVAGTDDAGIGEEPSGDAAAREASHG